ncbi:hypothetical protein BDB01DRAFT_846109 [Pilobolus umbonatus]|nr:hypothetical protein BDB01DRAFT_846109 [Pilobolus umbonatus]
MLHTLTKILYRTLNKIITPPRVTFIQPSFRLLTTHVDIPQRLDYSPRKHWSTEDTEKLIKLVNKYGNKWKVFTYYFPERTSLCIRAHYLSVKNDNTRWTLEEKKILQQYFSSIPDHDNIQWEEAQKLLPKHRTIGRIKQFYANTIHPNINKGSWTEEDSRKLAQLIETYGTGHWDIISKELGTRSEEQCRNKWAYEVKTLKKGDFTKEEDEALIHHVKKHGLDNLHLIKEEMKSLRSISQLRSRYNNVLDPQIDKSPWTEEEKEEAARLYAEYKNIKTVKAKMNSKRSIRDMYNHLRKR